jgi:hypothetical protein
MAGLFDRVNSSDNVNIHYVVAGIKGYGTGIWTRAQVLSGVNSLLVSPLGTAAADDFAAIADELDGKSNATLKLIYVNVIEAVMIAAASEVISEAGWRTALGIN